MQETRRTAVIRITDKKGIQRKMKTNEKTKKALLLFAAVFAVSLPFFLNSCGDKEGDWDSMVWESADKLTLKGPHHQISVPAEGRTYILRCKNYSSIWFNIMSITDASPDSANHQHITGEWYEATLNKDTLRVIVLPLKDKAQRSVGISVSVGDTGNSFLFVQK